jgi:hypothetical protein
MQKILVLYDLRLSAAVVMKRAEDGGDIFLRNVD